jgi:type III restriction enzyme
VLSLFFIDHVRNYRAEDGKDALIPQLFDEEFRHLVELAEFKEFSDLDPRDARAAYFAEVRSKGLLQLVDTAVRADSIADRAAFELIMRNKEQLLSASEPVSFVFSHSALREGWDNPNIFQICTLNDAVSTIRKRQEIGRGLRLAVNGSGERVTDEEVNQLTVVANESYGSYVKQLQDEMLYDLDGDAPYLCRSQRTLGGRKRPWR